MSSSCFIWNQASQQGTIRVIRPKEQTTGCCWTRSQQEIQRLRRRIYRLNRFLDVCAPVREKYIQAGASRTRACALKTNAGYLGTYGYVMYGSQNKREQQQRKETFEQE